MTWHHRQLKRRRGLVNVETTDRVSVVLNHSPVTVVVELQGRLPLLLRLVRALRK
jgi:hypothetical protein